VSPYCNLSAVSSQLMALEHRGIKAIEGEIQGIAGGFRCALPTLPNCRLGCVSQMLPGRPDRIYPSRASFASPVPPAGAKPLGSLSLPPRVSDVEEARDCCAFSLQSKRMAHNDTPGRDDGIGAAECCRGSGCPRAFLSIPQDWGQGFERDDQEPVNVPRREAHRLAGLADCCPQQPRGSKIPRIHR
jgi:hypothetical protein